MPGNTADRFVKSFKTWLDDLRVAGDTRYLEYIDEPHSGDEADVVDMRFVKGLLDLLGYSQGNWSYNRQKESNRPDWQVRLEADQPIIHFLVESKATAENLDKHVGQLIGYMRRFAVARGLLTNGKEVRLYQLQGDHPVPVLAFGVKDCFIQGSPGEEAINSLKGLYYRLERNHLLSIQTIIEDLTITSDGHPHAIDGSTWPQKARLPVIPAKGEGFLQRFTDDVRDLLRALKEDALSQLRARLFDLEEMKRSLWEGGTREEFEEIRQRLLDDLKHHVPEGQLEALKAELQAPWEEGTAAWRGRAERLKEHLPRSSRAAAHDRWQTSLDRLEHIASRFEERQRRLTNRYREAVRLEAAFAAWRAQYGFLLEVVPSGKSLDARLREEFSVQTAYVFLVRLLLIRIAEDKGVLERRMFTDGGIAEWLCKVEPYYLGQAGNQGINTFLSLVFGRAERDVYAHFFSHGIFDWYCPERDMALRLLWQLAHYDFSDVDQDIIGHLYTNYATEEHRHATGMYYTPPEVVDYILDRVGFRGGEMSTATLLDPACGSGTFLVKAARRVLDAFRGQDGRIPDERLGVALKAITTNLVGLDLNPFACYLAEINLLVQVVDLLKAIRSRGGEVHLDRFRIYNTDTLIAAFREAHWARGIPEEEVKLNAEAFDFVVGNPPYVRADAPGMKAYRQLVKNRLPLKAQVQGVLTQKWDLFVPFVALGLEWLREGGRLGMIVSRSVEEAPYAGALRKKLLDQRLLEVSHMNGRALFPDAVVDNTILVVEKGKPSPRHRVLKRCFQGKPTGPCEREEAHPLDGFPFERERGVSLASAGKTVAFGQICYISSGMELQADEKRSPGAFRVEDLLCDTEDDRHPRPYVDGSLIEPFCPRGVRWLEYGEGLRAPASIRATRVKELWDRQKILLQRILSHRRLEALWDRGQFRSFLTANHTATVAVRWCDLKGVQARQLGEVDDHERKGKEALSHDFCPGYLVGVLNTEAASERFRFKVTREGRVEADPDPLKELPIPQADPLTQRRIRRFALALEGVERKLRELEKQGWKLNPPLPPQSALHPKKPGSSAPLSAAEVSWGLQVCERDVRMRSLRREDRQLFAGTKLVLELPSGSPEALDWFVQMEKAGGLEGRTWNELKDLRVPRTLGEALSVLQSVEREVEKIQRLLQRRKALLSELERRVERLYATA